MKKQTDKEFFKENSSKPVKLSNFTNFKSPDINKINIKEFDYFTNDKKLYCDNCGYKSFIWAENEKYKDMDYESNQMLCPKCFSYNYFEDSYTWDLKITKWNKK